ITLLPFSLHLSDPSSFALSEMWRLDESQLANKWEVIGRQARERGAMDAELCGMQGGVHKNVIDCHGRQTGGKGAECPCRQDECSHITQLPGDEPMGARAPYTVEISEQNCRFIRFDGAEPCGSDE